jgi:hypothetical protein
MGMGYVKKFQLAFAMFKWQAAGVGEHPAVWALKPF